MSLPDLRFAVKALDEFSRTFKKFAGDLGAIEKQTTKTTGRFDSFKDSMKVAAGVMIRDFARSATRTLDESLRLGAQITTLQRSFERLVEATGDTTISLQGLREATRGTVSDIELLQRANQAMMLGLPTDQIEELFEAAIKLGNAMGIDAAFAVESLTIGIGRQSRLVLDNLGVIVKAEEAYKKYAEQIGVAANQLTEAQQKEAWQAEAIAKIQEKAAILGDTMSETQLSQQRFTAAIENFKTSVGKLLGPLGAVEPILQAWGPLITTLAITTLPKLIDSLGGIKNATSLFVAALASAKWELIAIAATIGGVVAMYEFNILGFRDVVNDALRSVEEAWVDAGRAIESISDPIGAFKRDFWTTMGPINLGLDQMSSNMQSVGDVAQVVSDEVGEAFGEIEESAESVVEVIEETFLGKAQQKFEEFQKCVGGKFQDLGGSVYIEMEQLAHNINDLIQEGFVGEAQTQIQKYVECSGSKIYQMVQDIEGYMTTLTEKHNVKLDEMRSYAETVTGLEREAVLYQMARMIQEYEAKIRHLAAWKEDLFGEMGDSSVSRITHMVNAINYEMQRLSEQHTQQLTEMRETAKTLFGQQRIDVITEMDALIAEYGARMARLTAWREELLVAEEGTPPLKQPTEYELAATGPLEIHIYQTT